jgi:hypothetical protein
MSILVCLSAQVLASQHNLPANSKRSLQYDVFVPNPEHPDQVRLFFLHRLSSSRMRQLWQLCES